MSSTSPPRTIAALQNDELFNFQQSRQARAIPEGYEVLGKRTIDYKDELFSFYNSDPCYRSAHFTLCFVVIGVERCRICYLAQQAPCNQNLSASGAPVLPGE
jgi:hypothetical protein